MKTWIVPKSHEDLVKLIDDFQRNNRISYSNFFGLSEGVEYDVMLGANTIVLRIPEFDYHRIYVLSSDATELITLLKSLDSEYVINIPTKKDIDGWDKLLSESGFMHYVTYSHYLNMAMPNMKKRLTSTGTFAKPDELQQIYDLLYRNFSMYASHLPNKAELAEMIAGNRVITDYNEDGSVCGVNIFTITGTTAYGNAWVDEGEKGLEIFFDMFNIFIDKGVKRFVFWVRDGNKNVIKMHRIMGAKPDGLKDYTYIKNKKNK